jgi:hypothetical protein
MATETGVVTVVLGRHEDAVVYGSWFESEPEARAFIKGIVWAHGVPDDDYEVDWDDGALVCRVEDHWLYDDG